MADNNLLDDYKDFVFTLTSMPSKDFDTMIERLKELNALGYNFPLLDTASDGLSSESGEFKEIIKKVKWQGKELDGDTVFHLKRELGDILFYWTMACISLNIPVKEVYEENIRKLENRYPGGFEVFRSENRAEDDL